MTHYLKVTACLSFLSFIYSISEVTDMAFKTKVICEILVWKERWSQRRNRGNKL